MTQADTGLFLEAAKKLGLQAKVSNAHFPDKETGEQAILVADDVTARALVAHVFNEMSHRLALQVDASDPEYGVYGFARSKHRGKRIIY